MKDDFAHSVHDIAKDIYCERKAALARQAGRRDRVTTRYGRADEAFVAMCAAQDGVLDTPTAQAGGGVGVGVGVGDRRCFIATAVFGPDAPQTDALRRWRDRVLMPRPLGRLLVRGYYAASPHLVPWLEAHPLLKAMTRRGLGVVVQLLAL